MNPEEIQRALDSLPPARQRALAKRLRKKAAETERAAERKADTRVFFHSPALKWTIAALLLYLAAEGLLFHLGWYNQYLEPGSTAGQVEGHMSWLKRYPHGSTPEVMVIGDSRIAEGFSARAAGQITGQRFRFWNFGIGGATPRVWYYMLRDGDPTRRRFAAIVIPLDHYTSEDGLDDVRDRLTDLSYLAGRLRFADCAEFALSMHLPDFRMRALTGCLFRGIPLRRDVEEFITNTHVRVKNAKDYRRNGMIYIDDYGGLPDDLRGLTADFVHRTLHFPPGVSDLRKSTIQAMVMPPPSPQTGGWVRYRNKWFGKILDLYKDSPTKIIFLDLPCGPIPLPPSASPETFPGWVRARSHAAVLPSGTFRDLERTDLYADGLHLNKIGRGLFTGELTQQVMPLLGGHS